MEQIDEEVAELNDTDKKLYRPNIGSTLIEVVLSLLFGGKQKEQVEHLY